MIGRLLTQVSPHLKNLDHYDVWSVHLSNGRDTVMRNQEAASYFLRISFVKGEFRTHVIAESKPRESS